MSVLDVDGITDALPPCVLGLPYPPRPSWDVSESTENERPHGTETSNSLFNSEDGLHRMV